VVGRALCVIETKCGLNKSIGPSAAAVALQAVARQRDSSNQVRIVCVVELKTGYEFGFGQTSFFTVAGLRATAAEPAKSDDLGAVLPLGRFDGIPSAKILHPHPNVRFDARYLR
jgi:hypothetical protein